MPVASLKVIQRSGELTSYGVALFGDVISNIYAVADDTLVALMPQPRLGNVAPQLAVLNVVVGKVGVITVHEPLAEPQLPVPLSTCTVMLYVVPYNNGILVPPLIASLKVIQRSGDSTV